MIDINDFWRPFEVQINSFDDLVANIERVMEKAVRRNIQFAWRGQVDAGWALHSSLYRRGALTRTNVVDEATQQVEETKILAELHRWGLHAPSGAGRLSILRQLAMLQHYGAPTRLIDITFNAWIGAWFAVEQKWSNAQEIHGGSDARLFAIDITNRLINEHADRRAWEDDLSRPWRSGRPDAVPDREWTTSVFAWKPSNLDARISAQNGAFLFGGAPATLLPEGGRFQFPKGRAAADGHWRIDEGREACCLALRPHVFDPVRGGVADGALYTFRIAAAAKPDIRSRLEKMFGYMHRTIYPDYTGFASFGTPWLKSV